MRKITNTPELKICRNSSTLEMPLKSPRVSKQSMALSSKFVSIKSKISDIITKKEKVKRDIVKVHKKFKISQKKEKSLEILSNSVENRINNLDKRKSLLKLVMSGSSKESNKDLIQQLRGYLQRFKAIMHEEHKLELAEHELFIKEEDFSFETRSSESTQAGSLQKDVNQIELLKFTITKTGEKQDGYTRNTNINKYKKENLLNKKKLLEWERTELDKEIVQFQKEFKLRENLRAKVLLQNEKVEKKIVQNAKIEKIVDETMKQNYKLKLEIKNFKRRLEGTIEKCKIEDLHKKVEEVEEKMMILKESVDVRKVALESQKNKVKVFEAQVNKKCDIIRKKDELSELLKKIEDEVTAEGDRAERRKRIQVLVQLALDKEKEVRASEN